MTKEELIAFEKDIAACYDRAEIRAPIHLSGGNEDFLIDFFTHNIYPEDWVFTTWRSHYHCLLKGVPPQQLKKDILAGRSITLNYKEQRVVSSAIVGGVLPMALGTALSIKRNGGTNKAWVFIGDMTALTGVASECARYARWHDLPLRIVVESNNLSVCTNTQEVWGRKKEDLFDVADVSYEYDLGWPHSGAGKRVNF